MIFIVSTTFDRSTDLVVEWLHSLSAPTLRINLDNFQNLSNQEHQIISDAINEKFKFVLWIRTNKAGNFLNIDSKSIEIEKEKLIVYFHEFYHGVLNQLSTRCSYRLGFDFFEVLSFNKLKYLIHAKNSNMLLVPTFLITSKLEDLKKFKSEQKRIITKCFGDVFTLPMDSDSDLKSLTIEITNKDIEAIPEIFPTSFFQARIEKKFDLKVFFLHDTIYPVILKSPVDELTDYRGDEIQSILLSKYCISDNFRILLGNYIKNLAFNIGVIDFVVSTDDKYYFLEVNPFGQFRDLSTTYDAEIEFQIAKKLLNEYKKYDAL